MFFSMAALPEDVPKIDWTYYKKSIVTPGLVEKFQKEYEALSIPYPVDKYTAEIESEEKQLVIQFIFMFFSYLIFKNFI